ncbi:MAG: hypothetical protein J6N49_03460 [Alphaproteobacteria bacterium]|nr:hypothetical protein [Alphaproteobacteria bacterium]
MAEALPNKTVVQRAKQIKPLVRIRHNAVSHYEKVFTTDATDLLVFTTLYDIEKSYLYNFTDDRQVVKHLRRPLFPRGMQKIGEFTCYHRFEENPEILSPCVEEVLRQLPDDINLDQINAFELKFDSSDPADVYDPLLDRYESTVVLYSMSDGLPQQIKQQPVVYHDVRY